MKGLGSLAEDLIVFTKLPMAQTTPMPVSQDREGETPYLALGAQSLQKS